MHYKKYPKRELFVIRNGRFEKLVPRVKREWDWRTLVFFGLLSLGFIFGYLISIL
jgi:hypothetical protein